MFSFVQNHGLVFKQSSQAYLETAVHQTKLCMIHLLQWMDLDYGTVCLVVLTHVTAGMYSSINWQNFWKISPTNHQFRDIRDWTRILYLRWLGGCDCSDPAEDLRTSRSNEEVIKSKNIHWIYSSKQKQITKKDIFQVTISTKNQKVTHRQIPGKC